jgi:hypothetical protein
VYPDTLKIRTKNLGAIILLYLNRLPPFLLYLETNTPGADFQQPGHFWVILHMIYTPIMSESLVDFVTFWAVTNVSTLLTLLWG